jgi:nitroreductase
MTPTGVTDRGLLISSPRKPEAGVDPLFIHRWSPRAFDPSPLPEETVRVLFEAARWAQSCNNEQPWLFIYGAGPEDHARILGLLTPRNQEWAKDAPLLAIVFARTRMGEDSSGPENYWAFYDCGAAWMALTIQARLLGLYTHGMAGFDRDRACEALGVPAGRYRPVAALAAGAYGDFARLSPFNQGREVPSLRKPLAEVAMRGRFSP